MITQEGASKTEEDGSIVSYFTEEEREMRFETAKFSFVHNQESIIYK